MILTQHGMNRLYVLIQT